MKTGGSDAVHGRADTEISQEDVDEAVFEIETDFPRGAADDVGEIGAGHRSDKDLTVAQPVGELGVLGGMAVEVRAHPDDDQSRWPGAVAGGAGGDECLDEGPPLGVGDVGGEQLLELVDDQQHSPRRWVAAGRFRLAAGVGGQQCGQSGEWVDTWDDDVARPCP